MNEPLFAVTICIGYGDYLLAAIDNRLHFDQWTIVTVSSDLETHSICDKFHLNCLDSKFVNPDGGDFNAASNKAPLLNEALDTFPAAAWAVVLDADILLPRDFRPRLSAMSLSRGCLYGMEGRRIARDPKDFSSIRGCEPWSRFVSRNSAPIGYFNLFHLAVPPNRYPKRGDSEKAHDDWLFMKLFPEEHRLTLPMTVLHAGPNATNWERRISAQFSLSDLEKEVPDTPVAGITQALVIGYYPHGNFADVFACAEKVDLIDAYGIHCATGSAILREDRSALQTLLIEDLSKLSSYNLLGPFSLAVVDKIPDGSVDALYVSGEIDSRAFSPAYAQLRSKLKEGARIFGEFYGFRHWPESTHAICLLFGSPESVSARGMWTTCFRHGAPAFLSKQSRDATEEGLIFVSLGTSTFEDLVLTLHSFRSSWHGNITVLHWGCEHPTTRVVCARLSIHFLTVSSADCFNGNYGAALEIARSLCFYESAIVAQPGILAMAPVSLPKAPSLNGGQIFEGEPCIVQRDYRTGNVKILKLPYSTSQTYSAQSDADFVLFSGESAEWTSAAWHLRQDWAQSVGGFYVTEIRGLAETGIVCVVHGPERLRFQSAWETWRFPQGTNCLVVLIGLRAADLHLAQRSYELELVELPSSGVDLGSLLSTFTDRSTTAKLLILSPYAMAMPGAEIPRITEGVLLHRSDVSEQIEAETRNSFLPTSLMFVITRKTVKAISILPPHERPNLVDPLLIRSELERVGVKYMTCDYRRFGWHLDDQYIWSSKADGQTIEAGASLQDLIVCPSDGMFRERAENSAIMVINLPSRQDRLAKVKRELQSADCNFILVPGVDVPYADIPASEYAQATRQQFKLKRGWPEYLRRMVGCKRAHLHALRLARRMKLASVLILEDDVVLDATWLTDLKCGELDLPPGWLQLYLSVIHVRPPSDVTDVLHRLAAGWQSTAILYSRSGIEAGINSLEVAQCELDVWFARTLHPFGCSYSFRHPIARQNSGFSDIVGIHKLETR